MPGHAVADDEQGENEGDAGRSSHATKERISEPKGMKRSE